SSESSSWGCYGDLQTLYAPGASCGTGRRRGLKYCVRASERLAERDMPYLLWPKVLHGPCCDRWCLVQESCGGNVLVNVDRPWPSCPTSWISKAQVSQMTEVLTVRIKEIQRRFPTWTPDQHLRALYNPRVGFPAWSGLCDYTRSSQDLSCEFCNGVLARAKYFKRQGF
ncbi:hypothetical protein EI555_021357, partial [Monodon monoceros]